MRHRISFDVNVVARDMAAKGWNNSALAAKARVSNMTVGRFLSGEVQTPKTAAKLARALGQDVSRYIVGTEAVAS